LSREWKRDKAFDRGARDYVKLVRDFVKDVWESDDGKEFFNYKIKGIDLNVETEFPMCMYRLSEKYEELLIEDILSSDKIMGAIVDKFKARESFRGSRSRYMSLGFVDLVGNTSVRPLVDVMRAIIGTSPEANILVATYAIVAVLAVRTVRVNKLEVSEMFSDCMGYWLKSKGFFNSDKVVVKRARMKKLDRVKSLEERVTDERYEQNLMEVHPRRGKLYADFKIGEVELEEFFDETTGIAHTDEFSRIVDLYEFMNNYMSEEEVEEAMSSEETKLAWSKCATASMRNIRDLGYYWGVANVLFNKVKRLEKKTSYMEESVRVANELKDRFEANEKIIKKAMRVQTEEKRELQRELKRSKLDVQRLHELEHRGIKDSAPFEEKIKKLEESVEEKVEKLIEKEREIGKLKVEVENINDKYTRLKKTHEEIVQEEDSEEDGNGIDIPTSVFVEAIKDRRIVVVGGDSLHAAIKELGFKDIRFEKVTANLNRGAFDSCDMVVYMTREISHSHIERAESAIGVREVKRIHYGYRSVQRLCREMFIALNS